MLHQRLLASFAVLASFGLLSTFFACNKKVKNDAFYQDLSQYIYAYTNGTIGRDEPVRVRFANAAVNADQVGKSVDAAVFSVSPEVKGQAVWEDDRTVLLKPEAPLKYGQQYHCKVGIGAIYKEAPATVRTFEFDFRVRELNFEVVVDGIQTPDAANLKAQQITGVVHSNEPVGQEELEKILSATQDNRALTITWNHTEGNKTHYFTANGVQRTMNRSSVAINWNGEPIGVKQAGNSQVPVPGLGDFEVITVRVVQTESQYLLINFSDPLSSSQTFDGLIRIEGYLNKFSFTTDGNFLRAYPVERLVGKHEVVVDGGIKNAANARMKNPFKQTIDFEDIKPGVRLVGRGAIIPGNSSGSVIFPFEAVALNAVDVEIFKIYNANILQYLQVNEIEGNNELERVGKIIFQKKISLAALNPNSSAKVWQRYALDLKDMIKQDPGAIYQVRLVYRRSYVANLQCAAEGTNNDGQNNSGPNAGNDNTQITEALPQPDEYGNLVSLWGGYRGIYWNDEDGWYDDNYDYDRRENPCYKEYYNNERFERRNVFVSDLGLTAKLGKDGSNMAVVTDLNTTAPVGGVQIEYYNYQLQSIGKTSTTSDGTVYTASLRDKPYILVATKGEHRGYLRMADGGSLSLSRFDVAGAETQKGLKGFIYGERGVWRPGDSVYLNFVLEDRTGKLPPGHPVNFELTDSRGALRYKTVVNNGVNGVFPLHFNTDPDAPTGNWIAKVEVGGAKFTQVLKIETVKPNRLKLALDFKEKTLGVGDEDASGKLSVRWLTGATAKNLKAKVDMQLQTGYTQFPNFKDFKFEDPARTFWSEEQTLFDGEVDENGNANVPLDIKLNGTAPGKLVAAFKVRAFEAGGDVSVDNFALDYYPYKRMIGIKVPQDKYGNSQIDLQKGGDVEIACVDKNGKPLSNRKVSVGLYRCDWRWWWDQDRASDVGQFNSGTHVNALESKVVTTDANGHATWRVNPATWGRYLVRAIDEEGGHASGDFFWVGYPDRMDDLYSRNAVAMLPLAADKEQYNAGEMVSIKVPASENGRVLMTLENGSRVVKHIWFDAKTGDNILTFKAEPEMAPAVYAHISLLQPHAQTKNDLPIRMYGIVPVKIENPATRLTPVIEMADVIKPGEPFTVKLKELGSKSCAYTLAIVDEGLLDLTRFVTPNPHDAFFAREALGVKTWDIYDYVLGAYGVELERILAIGGDAFNRKAKNAAQVNRFKPAVIHVGPFYLEKGKTATHKLKIDNYVGSVRVMAVMSSPAPNAKGAYGAAEKTCPVRKPLMILPTLPRVLGPGETLRLPIQVFAMEKQVKNATIRVRESSGKVMITGTPTQTLTFTEPGDQITYFELKVGNKTGPAHFTFEAQGGGETATDAIDIIVRNPMPYATKAWEGTMEPGKEWSTGFNTEQYAEVTNASLEVSALPSMNLSRHLDYLIRYPHGCLEQVTSAGFPQLFVDAIAPLTQQQKEDITKNVTAAIGKLTNRQDFSGGFTYWPGGYVDEWSSSYAGHFLLEAKNKGYAVSDNVIDRWVQFQANLARSWSAADKKNEPWWFHDQQLNQAYRLYTLAMAGKPSIADMNRLREVKDLYTETAYLLASAYAQAGKPEVARELVGKPWRDNYQYDWCGETYGSDIRDRSLILEAYTAIGDNARAAAMVNYLAGALSDEDQSWRWNTQSLSTALRALSKYAQKNSVSGPNYSYQLGGSGSKPGDASRAVSVISLTDAPLNQQLKVKNNGSVKLYARVVITGQQKPDIEKIAAPANIDIAVRYLTPTGTEIDPRNIRQGTDFVAEVTVRRKTTFKFPFNELAITQIFPSGWEITNTRMGNFNASGSSASEYQDFRDDRVSTYFDLAYQPSGNSVVYRYQLNASYKGRFLLPTVTCEAMYDNRIRAAEQGMWVEVI